MFEVLYAKTKNLFQTMFFAQKFAADENVTLSNMTDSDQTDYDNVTLNTTGEFLDVVRLVCILSVVMILYTIMTLY